MPEQYEREKTTITISPYGTIAERIAREVDDALAAQDDHLLQQVTVGVDTTLTATKALGETSPPDRFDVLDTAADILTDEGHDDLPDDAHEVSVDVIEMDIDDGTALLSVAYTTGVR